MARALWLADALREFGVNVIEVEGWQTRGSSTFDAKGVLAHHTASRGPYNAPGLNIVINGRHDLSGPLAQVLLARNGTAYIVASGRANHPGVGSWNGVSGSSKLLGIEAENDGVGEAWPDAQIEAYFRICAAMCLKIGVGSNMVAAHKEYATPKGRKIDPYGHEIFTNMDNFRNEVNARMNNQPTEGELVMDAEVRKEFDELKNILGAIRKDVILGEAGDNKEGTSNARAHQVALAYLRGIAENLKIKREDIVKHDPQNKK